MGHPDDWDIPDEPDECDCEDYDHDVLTGRATCASCGRIWNLSTTELEFLSQAQADWDAYMDRIDAAEPPLAPSGAGARLDDDDLPF